MNHKLGKLCLPALLAILGASTAIAQSHLARIGDIQDQVVNTIATLNLDDERLLTVATDQSGYLQLISWQVTADGTFSRQKSASAGIATAVAATSVNRTEVVTALQAQGGGLELIDWSVAVDGTITRRGDTEAGPIDAVSIATVGPERILTAVEHAGNTKLIVWDIDSSGNFQRRGDSGANAPAGVQTAVTPLSVAIVGGNRVALAVSGARTAAGQLTLTVWSIDNSGNLTNLSSATAQGVSDFQITGTAADRVVAAAKIAGLLQIIAWDVDLINGTHNLTAAGTGTGGEPAPGSFALAPLGGAKVVTALRQADGTLKLVTWGVVKPILELNSTTAGAVGNLSLATLGWDRIVAGVQDSANHLKLIDWADDSIYLLSTAWNSFVTLSLHAPLGQARPQTKYLPDSEFSFGGAKEETPGPPMVPIAAKPKPEPKKLPASPSVPQPLVFYPDTQGVDPMIAASKNYLIVSEDHWLEFMQKNGNNPPVPLPINGQNTISTTDFFSGLTSPTGANGQVNRSNVNLYLRFPLNTGTVQVNEWGQWVTEPLSCDVTAQSLKFPCMDEFYDTRVLYDSYSQRFIIQAAVRSSTNLANATQPVAQRLLAIAVSNSEDPRQGFSQYITTESNYSDWPRMATSNGVLVMAHQGCKNPDGKNTCGINQVDASACAANSSPTCPSGSVPTNVPMNHIALRPMAYVLRMADLTAGLPFPGNWKIYPYQMGGGNVFPISNHGDAKGWTFLLDNYSPATVYGFQQPNDDWFDRPKLSSASTSVPSAGTDVHYQSGSLYICGSPQVAARVPNVSPAQYSIDCAIEPVTTQNGLQIGPCPSGSTCQFTLGSSEDAPANQTWSYEMASAVPNSAGDLFVLIGAVPVNITSTPQQIRYSIRSGKNGTLYASQLLKQGDLLLQDVACGETQPVNENFSPPQSATGETKDSNGKVTQCGNRREYLDYATATVDPDGNFWFAHAYPHLAAGADPTTASGRLVMVAGRVIPPSASSTATPTATGAQITSITPTHGPITGGTSVLINGQGFPPNPGVSPNMPVSFGAAQTSAVCTGSTTYATTECTVTAPPYAQTGTVDIVAMPYGTPTLPSAADQFTYDPYPQLTTLQLPLPGFPGPTVVSLNGNAPAGGAVVALASSDPNVAQVPSTVTIPAGSQTAAVQLTVYPAAQNEQITLTATYQGSTTNATLAAYASPPLAIQVPGALDVGESGSVTISLNTRAPAAGAVVALTSSDPSAIAMPPSGTVTVPSGTFTTTFSITNIYSGKTMPVTISASYNGATASGSVQVPPVKTKTPPTGQCPKGWSWDAAQGGCSKQKTE